MNNECELAEVLIKQVREKFVSGNSVPVERAWVAAYEWQAIEAALLSRADGGEARDAARYRWLRECDYAGDEAIHTPDGRELKTGADLDAAIDAAMAKERT